MTDSEIPQLSEIDDLKHAYRFEGVRKVRDDGTVYTLQTDHYNGEVYLIAPSAQDTAETPKLGWYICDGCRNRIDGSNKQCPRCGTLVDGKRRLAKRRYE